MRKGDSGGYQEQLFARAKTIAARSLRANYGLHGLLAGRHQFADYWARDGFFASWGALALGDSKIVKRNLLLFLGFQREDGQIPLRVSQHLLFPGFIGLHIHYPHLHPVFTEDKQGHVALDQNCLLVITARMYAEATKDAGFIQNNFAALENAVLWLQGHVSSPYGLLAEHAYGGWVDSIKKEGFVLYSNVCFYKALNDLSSLAFMVKKRHKGLLYARLAAQVKRSIRRHFWSDTFFSDIVQEERNNVLSADGNMLAMLWGLCSADEPGIILREMEVRGMDKRFSFVNHDPMYPLSMKPLSLWLIGLEDYHDGVFWLWLGALGAAVKQKYLDTEEARRQLNCVAKVIVGHDDVHEVYTLAGKPVKRLLYTSEFPFSWNAGMFLWAASILNK